MLVLNFTYVRSDSEWGIEQAIHRIYTGPIALRTTSPNSLYSEGETEI